jgi:undecaprenyl-diphosphatase
MTARYWIDTCLARIDAAEYRVCQRINHGASRDAVRRVFCIASRLGDGFVWYALMLALPLLYGDAGTRPVLVMAITGLVGLVIYKALKRVIVRERPFITHFGISLGALPLDRYSFPSGHTLHAVAFTWLAVESFPELAWVLVPLAALIAASRVVLGLHYPTDVLAGAAIGGALAATGASFI